MIADEESTSLSPEQVRYYRKALVTHANDAQTGVCRVCGTARCADWRGAYDRLALACELMTEPRRWADLRHRPETRPT